MRPSDMTALITGANGFIGRHLILEFLNCGYAVIAGVRETSNVQRICDLPIEIIRLDYLDATSLKQKLRDAGPNIIVHNAGITVGKRESDYFKGNTISTRNLLEASVELKLSKFVYISSLAARGPGKGNLDSPISPYGRSKLEAERLVQSSGIKYTIIRPTAVYGPEDKAFEPIFTWANRGIILQLGSSNRKLTFVHVSDLSKIILDSVLSEDKLIYGWDGENYQQRDLVDALKKAVGRKTVLFVMPSWLFRASTNLLDWVIRKVSGRFWNYPTWKVVELLADDWSILEECKSTVKIRYLLEKGFEQAYNHWTEAEK